METLYNGGFHCIQWTPPPPPPMCAKVCIPKKKGPAMQRCPHFSGGERVKHIDF